MNFRPTTQQDYNSLSSEYLNIDDMWLNGEVYSLYEGNTLYCIIGSRKANNHCMVYWSLFSDNTAGKMLSITKIVKMLMSGHNFVRSEMTVKEGFDEGMKWAKMLGFKVEGLVRKLDGHSNYYLLSKIKK